MGELSRLPLWAAMAGLAACALDESPSEPAPEKQEVFCTLAGCGPAFELRALLEASLESLRSAEVRVCRNAECRTGQFRSEGDSFQTGVTLEPSAETGPSSAPIWIYATATDQPDRLELEVLWLNWDWSQLIAAEPDDYEVTIASNGMTVFSSQKTVTEYELSYPNGPKCGPICSYARFIDD